MDMSCRHLVLLSFVFAVVLTTAANRADALTKSAGAGPEHAQLRPLLAVHHKGHDHQFSALQYNSQLHASRRMARRSLAAPDILPGSVRTAVAATVLAEPQAPVRVVNNSYPFSVIGQLSNGCSAFLVGPCHVLTVAHCTYDPNRNIWWPGLEFHPGRNVWSGDVGWQPLGVTSSRAVKVPPGWRASGGQPQHDYALIITQQPIGERLGWLNATWDTNDFNPLQAANDRQQSALPQPRDMDMLPALLHGAGYPDNKPNGTMWYVTNCSAQDWQFMGRELLWHDCRMRGGDSGAPLWVQLPSKAYSQARQQQGGQGPNAPAADGAASMLRVVGMHIGAVPSVPGVQQHGASHGPAADDPGAKPLAVPFYGSTAVWRREAIASQACSSK